MTKLENSLEKAAMQTIEVIRMKDVPVLRSSVGKISLMMICNPLIFLNVNTGIGDRCSIVLILINVINGQFWVHGM